MLFKRNPIKNLLLYIIIIPFLFLGCGKGEVSHKELLLSKVSLKIQNSSQLYDDLNTSSASLTSTYRLYVARLDKRKDKKNDSYMQLIYKVATLDSSELEFPYQDKITFTCKDDKDILFQIYYNIYSENSLLLLVPLEELHCFNSLGQVNDISTVYTAKDEILNGYRRPDVILYTSNPIILSAQEINEAFALYQESLDE